MGHKVNPIGLRVGINRTWDSRWFASRAEYGRLLHEDMHIRDHILKQQRQAGISKVVIERPHKKCRVTVHTARPGVLIGKKGADIEKLQGRARQAHLLGGASQHRRGAGSPRSTPSWWRRRSPSSSSAASPSAAP